ncbi:MAG: McrC family protein [Chryseobacterium sp.]|jgi:5-methylcytosine-specific restriction enzyme subunit McrC|uniref:McrC family protein n=1 Tax=Chryseobacterium sp. TaxID=1871047 RepID=UPI00283456F8|nr:hypothetical protein [Chryseobacterium sp.]MDR2235288.1 McrC family protein [Chryseobacterium sp.]
MSWVRNIVVFEHGKHYFTEEEKKLKLNEALENYYGDYSPFFKLIRNGIEFNQYVGILKVGNTIIEVLPKADRNDEDVWRRLLIDMIKTVWGFEVKVTGNADLKLKGNSILDLYFELYIKELEFLLHRGLVKRYNRKEGNLYTMKGQLHFSKHISQNSVHKERFYVKYTEYNVYHKVHCILYKALKLINTINSKPDFKSRLGALVLNFPEMDDIKITESVFDKIVYDRKNQHYERALQIAKLLLLNYHPDVSKGRNNVLALMFDMNRLWEQFVFVVLRKGFIKSDVKVRSQISKEFWKSEDGIKSRMKPDIVLESKNTTIVLDTKWKNLYGKGPSPEDLRQMYAYHHYYKASATALIYPGEEEKLITGKYASIDYNKDSSQPSCGVAYISTHHDIKIWKNKIILFIKEKLLDV